MLKMITGKLDQKAMEAHWLGYSSTSKGVGDLSYILIGSAGMELKAKNISKKSLSYQKTVSLLVSISFQ